VRYTNASIIVVIISKMLMQNLVGLYLQVELRQKSWESEPLYVVKVLQVDCSIYCFLAAPETVCQHCSYEWMFFFVTALSPSMYSNSAVNTHCVIHLRSMYGSTWLIIKACLPPPALPTSNRSWSVPVVHPCPPPAPGPRLSDRPRKPRRWPDSQSDYYTLPV